MSTITWLADLHGRAARAKRLPRQPTRADISELARELAFEVAQLPPDDPRLLAEQAELVTSLLKTQEIVYEHKLTICYTVIAALAAALIFASVLLAAIAGKL